jgi:hypothetical protein
LLKRIAFPDSHDFVIGLRSFDHRGPNAVSPWDQYSIGGEKPLPGVDDGRDVLLEKRQNPAHIRDDDVGSRRKLDFARQGFEKLNSVRALIRRGDFPGHLDDAIGLNREDPACAEFAGEHSHEPWSGANFQHDGFRPDSSTKCAGVGLDAETVCEHASVRG